MKKIRLTLSVIVIAIVVAYINFEISSGNSNYYFGKDDGVIVRVESVCILSALFYPFMSSGNILRKLLQLVVGFLIGILSSLTSFIILYSFSSILSNTNVVGLLIHILACIIFILTFFLKNKFQSKITT